MPAGEVYTEQSQRYNMKVFVKILNVVNPDKGSIAGDLFAWELQKVSAEVHFKFTLFQIVTQKQKSLESILS